MKAITGSYTSIASTFSRINREKLKEITDAQLSTSMYEDWESIEKN